MARKWWILTVLVALGLGACGGDEASGGQPNASTGAGGTGGVEGHVVHEDLLAHVHLADVEHEGLFIDIGTPAAAKYTLGDFRTGFGREGADGDTTFANVGQRAQVYFDADQAGPMTVRVRLKPIGTQAMTPYINGTQVPSIRFPSTGQYADYDIPLPAVRVGENSLLLTFGGTVAIGGENVAAAIDSIRIVPGTSIPGGDYAAPTFDTLVRTVSLGGQERRALVARRPTSFRYYVQVPAAARLGFGVAFEGQGTANVKVLVRADGAAPAQVFAHAANGEWHGANVDLSRWAGQTIGLDFVAEGQGAGQIAWSQPAVYTPSPANTRQRPARNVVVLLVDTLRADKMHPWNPRSRVRTPTIDGLAQQGTIFEQAHSVENWTKPSVASVLTGLYPRTHLARQTESVLSSDALLLSEHMHGKGFTTASFLANGYVSDRFGFNQGWDHYTNYIREGKNTDASNVFREAGEWIEQNREKRFFVYIQTIDPHVPYDPPEEYLRMYDPRTDYAGQVTARRTPDLLEQAKREGSNIHFDASDVQRLTALHDGEISQHDHELGAFIERLQRLGLWEDTLFVLTSDHGEEFDDHGSWGHGHSVFEELLHVPLLVRLPGVVPANRRVPDSVGTLSIPATVLDLAGVEAMPNLEGPSLVGYMNGSTPARPSVSFSDFMDDRRVVTAGRWKLVVRGNLRASFFDLQADPGERSPLELTTHPVAARFCRIMLGQFLGATNRSRWIEAEQGRGAVIRQQSTEIDETTRGQLRALGYAN